VVRVRRVVQSAEQGFSHWFRVPVHETPPATPRLRVAGLGPFRFKEAVRPGARLIIEARVLGRFGGLVKVEGHVHADGVLVADGSVTLGTAGPLA